jgi:predicted Zn-dependent protease
VSEATRATMRGAAARVRPAGSRRIAACALLAAATIAGCARNPVTGNRELALISEEQEIAMGQQAATEVEASLGLVDDAELQRYVQEIGAALAAGSQRPNLPWRFRVVEDPTPNAFALPGGFIYVTRGMMNFMENEAELATVLGHEIGHVTARHSVQQMSRQQLAQLGLGIGAILSPTVAELGGTISGGLQLLFLKYGRDDERQSDELGFGYALQAGYDVREMDDVFAVLQRIGESEGSSPVPAWASTHPDPGERVETAQQRIAALQQPAGQLRLDRTEYLQRIDGLVFGDNPRDGFFQSGRFIHPDLRFTLGLPQGWRAQNTPQAVVAMSPQQDAAIQLTLAQGQSPQSAAQQFLSQQGLQAGQPFSANVNGVPAVASYFAAPTEQGTIQGLVAFFGYEGRTYQVMGYAPEGRFSQYDATFRQVLGSFAPLTDQSLLAVQPNRMRVVRLSSPTTVAELAQRYPAAPADLLAILNQLPGTGATIPAGTSVKVVAR